MVRRRDCAAARIRTHRLSLSLSRVIQQTKICFERSGASHLERALIFVPRSAVQPFTRSATHTFVVVVANGGCRIGTFVAFNFCF